jgi:hypothetical protein
MNTRRFSFVRLNISIAIALTGMCCVKAQVVDFRNNQTDFPTVADRDVYSGTVFLPLVGTNFHARLLYGPDASSLQPATYVTPAPFRPITPGLALAGTWTGGNRTLTGFMAGQIVTLQVQVWDAGPGPNFRTFEDARASGLLWCESAPFPYTIPAPGSFPTAFYMDNLRSFCYIPEPSVVALGAVGFFAMVLLKNRRHSIRNRGNP